VGPVLILCGRLSANYKLLTNYKMTTSEQTRTYAVPDHREVLDGITTVLIHHGSNPVEAGINESFLRLRSDQAMRTLRGTVRDRIHHAFDGLGIADLENVASRIIDQLVSVWEGTNAGQVLGETPGFRAIDLIPEQDSAAVAA
jgi:hypothetical protein